MEGRPGLSELKACCFEQRRSACGNLDARPSEMAVAAPMMNTAFLLMAQDCGAAGIPLDDMLRDCFWGQSRVLFLATVDKGEIQIPVTRLKTSRKAMVATRLVASAASIDARGAASRQEFEAMSR